MVGASAVISEVDTVAGLAAGTPNAKLEGRW
jgi:hypothetical protein